MFSGLWILGDEDENVPLHVEHSLSDSQFLSNGRITVNPMSHEGVEVDLEWWMNIYSAFISPDNSSVSVSISSYVSYRVHFEFHFYRKIRHFCIVAISCWDALRHFLLYLYYWKQLTCTVYPIPCILKMCRCFPHC